MDVSTPDPDADPVEQAVIDARAIVEELRRYDPELADKPRWLVLNKLDMVADPEDTKQRFLKLYDWTGPVFGISGLSGEGTQDLIYALQDYRTPSAKRNSWRRTSRRHLRGRRPALRRHALGRHAGRPDRRRRISHNRSFIRLRLFAPQSALIMSAESTAVSVVSNAQRIVAKVGSSLVTNEGRGLDRAAVAHWAAQIAALRKQGRQVVLVSSGAIAEGMARLGWRKRPSVMHELQAAAAVGQMGLCRRMRPPSRNTACAPRRSCSPTKTADRHRYLNARSTLFALLRLGVVPIVNENDTVVTDEIRLGDNDTLGALVTNLIEADTLVILTDQRGLYDSDPRKNPDAKFISHAQAGDAALEAMAAAPAAASAPAAC